MNGGKKSIWEVWTVLWDITENCEIEKSCIYHNITYALAVLKKVENGIIVDQMKTVGWLNTVLDQHYSAYKTDLWYLHKGNWDKCYLEEHYDFLSAIEVYFYLFGIIWS